MKEDEELAQLKKINPYLEEIENSFLEEVERAKIFQKLQGQ